MADKPKRTPVGGPPTKKKRRKRKAKKPPPKKDSVVDQYGEMVKAVVTRRGGDNTKGKAISVPKGGKKSDYLRNLAGYLYTTDIHGYTLESLHSRPEFKDEVSYQTICFWSAEDHWKERRKALQEKWRKEVERKIGNDLAKARREALGLGRDLLSRTMDEIDSKQVAPRSFEGLVGTAVKLIEMMDVLGGKVAAELSTTTPDQAQATGPQVTPKLTKEESREAAKAILAVRRERMRREAKEQEEANQEKAKSQPQFQVIKGEK